MRIRKFQSSLNKEKELLDIIKKIDGPKTLRSITKKYFLKKGKDEEKISYREYLKGLNNIRYHLNKLVEEGKLIKKKKKVGKTVLGEVHYKGKKSNL